MNLHAAERARSEIYAQALREYSDACAEPALTPSCPYFRLNDEGRAWCLEECMDLLGENPPSRRHQVLFVGDDGQVLHASPRKPRTRRPPAPNPKVFDAAEILLEDRSKAYEDWRPSALLDRLHILAAAPLSSAPAMGPDLDRTLELLGRYGIDGVAVLRTVYAKEIAEFLAFILAVPDEARPTDDRDLGRWREVLGVRTPQSTVDGNFQIDNEVMSAVRARASKIEAWLQTLAPADLASWAPPTSAELAAADNPAEAPPEIIWVVDRFAKTYLESWRLESLKLEWRYLRGECPPPCTTPAMRYRHVPASAIADAIAAKVAGQPSARRSEGLPMVSLFVPIALEHLNAGRTENAAAIFDACRTVAPDDGEAHNNFAFCILPTDPAKALAALELAADRGYGDRAVNVANRMLALHRLGRASSALEVAGRFASGSAWRRVESAHLWDCMSDEARIIDVADVRAYIAGLAHIVADASGDASASARWRERLNDLENPSPSE